MLILTSRRLFILGNKLSDYRVEEIFLFLTDKQMLEWQKTDWNTLGVQVLLE